MIPKHGIGRFLVMHYEADFIVPPGGPRVPAFNLTLGVKCRRYVGFCDMQQDPHFRFGFRFYRPTEQQIARLQCLGSLPDLISDWGPGAEEDGWWWMVYKQTVTEPIDDVALAALFARVGQELEYLVDYFDALNCAHQRGVDWGTRLFFEPEAGQA